MTDNKNSSDIKTTVFAMCDDMLREDVPLKGITSRKVASRSGIHWSHTTVAPHVGHWHEKRMEKERESIEQTQMSQNFVKALHKEVEDRSSAVREVDIEQMKMVQSELNDMIETNVKIENAQAVTEAKLRATTEEVSKLKSLFAQCTKDKDRIELDGQNALALLQGRYDKDMEALKSQIEFNRSAYETEKVEIKAEFTATIDKITAKNEDLHSNLKDKTAECAEASVKLKSFDKLTNELDSERAKVLQLGSDVIKKEAEINISKSALLASEKTTLDCQLQRDKAQDSKGLIESELKELQLKYQAILVKAASSGITIDD